MREVEPDVFGARFFIRWGRLHRRNTVLTLRQLLFSMGKMLTNESLHHNLLISLNIGN